MIENSTPRVRAPELPSGYPWLNCDRPLRLKHLRGRVVLLDFWTYCCINCLHVLPDLKYLEEQYPNDLTVIGIHSAKFDGENSVESVRQAILRYEIGHPVLVDLDRQVWQQYAVRAWPTLVLIDPQGYVVASLAGEGNRQRLEALIGQMVGQKGTTGTLTQQPSLYGWEKHRQPLITPLAFPGQVWADEAGDRLFIADSGHHRLVISSLAGQGWAIVGTGDSGLRDGPFSEAQFSNPQGMALDPDRNRLYVADTGNHAIRCVDLAQQQVTTLAGTGQQSRILAAHGGLALETDLNSPWDLVLVGHYLFIAMAGSHQIYQLGLDSGQIQTFAGMGAESWLDGPAASAAFAQPSGICTNGTELFVADSESSAIRGIGLGPQPVVRTICGGGGLFHFGDRDGQAEDVQLQHCMGVAFAADHLWVADTYNHKIKRVNPVTGDCHTFAGTGQTGCQDGPTPMAQFAEPSGLSATQTSLYVADTNNHLIRRIDRASGMVTTVKLMGVCAPRVCLPDT